MLLARKALQKKGIHAMTSPIDPSLYCRICKTALTVWSTPAGVTRLAHAQDTEQTADHKPDPALLADLPGAIQFCDFCDGFAAVVYTVSEELITGRNIVTAQWTTRRDQLLHGPAARARRTETERLRTDNLGRRHGACDPCAALLETQDLPRLVSRAADALPAPLRTGRKLLAIRGELYANFQHILDHRRPGRHRITATEPLGVFEPSPPKPVL